MHERGPGGGQRSQEMPAPVQRHHNEPGVEDGDVTEQAQRVVLVGVNQDRRKETAQHAEDGNHHGIEPNGDQEGGGGDERHQQEGRECSEKFKVID